jgi:hypothetical protein
MVPLATVIRTERRHRASKMPFADWDHPVETFFVY